MQTNPAFGGMPLEFLQARHLAETAETANADPARYVVRWDEWAARNLGVWFNAQIASSREQRKHIEAGVRGTPIAPPRDDVSRFLAALATLSAHEPEINAVQLRFFNMLMAPQTLIQDPVAMPRVHEYLRTHVDGLTLTPRPGRSEFGRLVLSRPA